MGTKPLDDNDFLNKQFSSWTVIGIGEPDSEGRKRYRCQCKCGYLSDIRGSNLKKGTTLCCRSCAQEGNQKGLIHGHMSGARKTGKSTLEYSTWKSMIQRCCNKNAPAYKYYGDRGITVADEWLGKGGFVKFLEHVGPRPSRQYTLDRIDNNKGYCPGNVRWVTKLVQQRNRRDNTKITIDGITKSIYEWAEFSGLDKELIRSRLRLGWNPKDAITEPKHPKNIVTKG